MKTAHHTRIKFLFNLLFQDLEPPRKKTKEEKRKERELNKDYINLRHRYWRNEINRWQSDCLSKKRKRARQKNPSFLNSEGDGLDGHHLDNKNVVYIPKDVHCSVGHRFDNPESMNRINLIAWDCLESGVL